MNIEIISMFWEIACPLTFLYGIQYLTTFISNIFLYSLYEGHSENTVNLFLFHNWKHCSNATNVIVCMKVIQVRGKNFMSVSDSPHILHVNNHGKCSSKTIQMLCTCYYPVSQWGKYRTTWNSSEIVHGQGNVMAECNVYQWVEQFNEGWMTTQNEDWSAWPSTTIIKETMNIVRAILNEDHCYTLDDFHHKMAIQYSYVECLCTSIFNILTNELEQSFHT